MKYIQLSVMVALCVIINACRSDAAGEPVVVGSPCSTFVAQFGPNRTPRLEKSVAGHLLFLSFTPAKNEEASSIIRAVRRKPHALEIAGTGQTIIAVKYNENHELVVPVSSEKEARSALKHLCFKNGDLYVPERS